ARPGARGYGYARRGVRVHHRELRPAEWPAAPPIPVSELVPAPTGPRREAARGCPSGASNRRRGLPGCPTRQVRAAIAELDDRQPLAELEALTATVDDSVSPVRVIERLL